MGQLTASAFWTHPPAVLDGVPACVYSRATAYVQTAPSPGPEPSVSAKRVREFAAGRHCAAYALADAGSPVRTVGIGRVREPVWPVGFVGSITHSASFAWAAAASVRSLRSIGIDSEPIFDCRAMRDALPLALDAGERALIGGTLARERATLGFSAKESLFKCLHPCSGVFIEFADVALEWIREECESRGTFGLRLRRSVAADFPVSTHFAGRYALDRGHVHTAVLLRG